MLRRPAATVILPLLALLAAGTLLVAVPMLALLQTALEDGLAALAAAVASAAPAIAASLWTSLGATILAVAIGATLAILTERTDVPGRRGLRLAMLVAFIVPGYVAAVGWLNAYGPGGVLDDLLGVAAPALIGPLGIIIVLGVEAAPIAYLVVAAGLATRAEPDLERAARASGADAATAFRSVTLPLLRPVLAGAAAIAFVLSVTSFGVPAVLGVPAGFTTMTTRIYRDLAFSSDPDSFVRAVGLALVLAVGAALVIGLADVLLERHRTERSGAFGGPFGHLGATPSGQPAEAGGARWRPRALGLGFVAWLLVILVIIVPLVALLLSALTRAPGLDPVPANWTLEHFREVLGPADPRRPAQQRPAGWRSGSRRRHPRCAGGRLAPRTGCRAHRRLPRPDLRAARVHPRGRCPAGLWRCPAGHAAHHPRGLPGQVLGTRVSAHRQRPGWHGRRPLSRGPCLRR